MKTQLTILFTLLSLPILAQVRPDQQPVKYDITGSTEFYTLSNGSIWRVLVSTIDSTSSVNVYEKSVLSDTSSITDEQRGDIMLNSGKDTIAFRGTYGWLVFAGGGGTWGSITGTLSNQTDLQSALDAKLSAEVDGSTTNEIQTIDTFSIASNTLSASLSSDGEAAKTVDLSPYLDNTDAQTLSLSSDSLTISGGNTIDITNYATTSRAFTGEILLDDINGIYYSDFTQTAVIGFTAAVSGHLVGSDGYIRIVSNATDSVNFSSDFNHVYGFTSGKALAAGTYEIYFHKTPSGISVNIPGAVEITASTTVNPLTETPFLALVGDSTSTITKDVSDNVSAWASVSPGTYTVRQGTGANQPNWVNDTYDYVDFTIANSDYMIQDTIATDELTGNDTPFSWVIVHKLKDTTVNAFQSIFNGGNSGDNNFFMNYTIDNADSLEVSRRETDTAPENTRSANAGIVLDQDWHIVAGSFTGTTVTLYYDGTKVINAVDMDVDAVTLDQFTIGALRRISLASHAGIQIRNLYMFNTAKSDAKLKNMSDYLNAIYSIY